MQSPTSEVYLHEMPGGQFTNLKAQARSMGMEDRWHDIARTYADVNQMFGDVIKVTPIAKTVGDLALMMVSQGLTCEDVLDPATEVSFPDSVITLMKGYVGQAPGGFPPAIVKKVLKGEEPITVRPGTLLPAEDLDARRAELVERFGESIDSEDLMGSLMYPKVFAEYMERHAIYGPVRTLPTRTFFYGMQPGEEISVEIDPGKILEIRLQALSETNEQGRERKPRPYRRADARRGGQRGRQGGGQGRRGRPAADHRGDEDGNRPPRRPRRGGQGGACPARQPDRRQGFAGGVRVTRRSPIRHRPLAPDPWVCPPQEILRSSRRMTARTR
jgi:hypothetical protein